jgi:murein DD-endopeptidase MepM/ murein hydrolase activator NlpD
MTLTEMAHVLRDVADQLAAMEAPPLPVEDHWLAFPLIGVPVKVTGEFGVMYTVGGITWRHEGIDFGLSIGTPIYACAAGQVVIAGVRGGYGNCIRIQHQRNRERWWTWYGHLLMMRCKAGDIVDAGNIIAASGNTGNTTGPHLHLTVQREDDKTLPAGCNEILRGCVNPRLFVKWPE